MKPLFITGIGTDIGKTVAAAILAEKLRADYWKPVQSGDLENSDTHKVRNLVSNSQTRFHSETYKLTQPFSPHKSAALDAVEIDLKKIILPVTDNRLIIEGAGGLMVPLNNKDMIIDLIQKLDAEVILVSKNYLGSINHTLLSLELLKVRNIPLKGVIFNGKHDNYSEDIILNYSGAKLIGRIPLLNDLNKTSIIEAGKQIDQFK